MTASSWSLRALAALALATAGARADAQPQPHPLFPAPQPKFIVYPSIDGRPGIPAWQFNPPAYNPGPFYNPALNNPYLNQTQFVPYNPLAVQPVWNPGFNNPFVNQIGWNQPLTTYTYNPPLVVQQPGQLMYRGPDLQVNPVSGLVYRPLSGVAQTRDGSIFYRVAGSGLPTVTGTYAPGTGLYYDPQHNTFLNPGTGVLTRPGTTSVFVPWIPPGRVW